MRIRSTKPEFWRSRRIAAVDWEARFVLKGLESYVDDNGVGKDDLALMVGDLFSRDLVQDPSGTLKRVSEAIRRLHEAGLVHRYEVEGTDLIYVSFWESIQYINRPSKGRFRRPDGTLDYGDSEIGSSLQSPQEPSRALSAGTGEQGNRGTGTSSSEIADAIPTREDVERLCTRLADHIEANGGKRPSITKGWRDAARLLIDRDERTEQQIAWIIDWCQRDEFWHTNILSMPKLREKFDQLVLKSRGNVRPLTPPTSPSGEPIIPIALDDRR